MCIRDSAYAQKDWGLTRNLGREFVSRYGTDDKADDVLYMICLLYTSDAADERSSVDLGGRRIIKKKTTANNHRSRDMYEHIHNNIRHLET